ncbi:uncharacterized protein CCR75_009281 [Bremia lactucae]|uniref:Neutral/alkaline non-lysosomal ceramidase C-terminal domain-containing protein n=1 Tax=Bremia lactucae TaxID=4779 RepID=A0A976FMP0_BRELC|nr:hypothetical protein CCR75_009281 [Bremia lactucae]
MFGYAKVGQLTSNIHMRLRAHAFAFQDLESKGMGVLDYNIPVIHDGVASGASFGSVVAGADVINKYEWGSTVKVCFHAAHQIICELKRWMEDSSRLDKGIWVMYLDDGDTDTSFRWERQGTFRSQVTIEWCISESTSKGNNPIKINGNRKHCLLRSVTSYSGASSAFLVVNSGVIA